MASPSQNVDGSAGLPRWVVSSIGVVVFFVVGLFLAGQLGHHMGSQAAADALERRRLAEGGDHRNLRDASTTVARQPAAGVDAARRTQIGGSQPQADPRLSVRSGSNFVLLPLPNGVTIELPKNWVAMSENQRVTMDAASEAGQDLAGAHRPTTTLPFAANLYDDARNVLAMLNVRFYPDMEWTQDFVRGLSVDELSELNALGRAESEASLQRNKTLLLEWKGTKRRELNGFTALEIEYRRTGVREGTAFCVRLVRVINAGRSFTVTVSYRQDAERLVRPICDRIIESIRQEQE